MTTDLIDPAALADLDLDLDLDLEQTIPCQSTRPECDAEATWRYTVVHRSTGAVCATRFRCDRHAHEYRAFLASPGENMCVAHRLEVDVRWYPLHPGGR